MTPRPDQLRATLAAARTIVLMALLLGGLLAATSLAAAEKVVIYRCTAADGTVTIQNNTPCGKGMRQERRVMEVAPASSQPTVATPEPAATAPATTAVRTPTRPSAPPAYAPAPLPLPAPVAAGERLPPPVLWECRTYADETYLTETREPQQRCVTTSSSGKLVEAAPGEPCDVRTDQCARVPDESLCDAWRKRLHEAQSALRYGTAPNRQLAQLEVSRLQLIVRDSTCGD